MAATRTTWDFHAAGQLLFGNRAIQQLPSILSRRAWDSVLIVTDSMLEEAGIVAQVASPLRHAGVRVEIFAEGEAEPSLHVAEKAITRANQCDPAAIMGLGGGSNMDLAKITAVVVKHGGGPADYFGWDRVPGPIGPLVCVPTTAGTGSEVSHAAVVTDTANKIKVSTLSQHLRPTLAVVDPELTFTCPRTVTADSGIDALTHAIEAYTATDHNRLDVDPLVGAAYGGRSPLTDCLAEKAIRLIGENLVKVVRQPQDRSAREGMSLAATLAGMAFSNAAVALVHALEYPLGGALHCSHGAGNGLLLPHVMRFNLPERIEAMGRIASMLGVNTTSMNSISAAESAIEAVDRIRSEIGVPARIRDLGGREEQLPEFAARSFAIKRLLQVNPRVASEADLLGILRAAF